MSFSTNYILSKKYRILEELGSSSLGSTYLAETIKTPIQKVIIKEYSNFFENSKESTLRKVNSQLNGISHLLDSFGIHKNYYQVFEFISNAESLRELINRNAPLSEEQTLYIGIQLFKIVQTLHSMGLAHGDIKPSNILITSDQDVKLIDFGIASEIGKIRAKPVGSIGYAAPEQYHGKITPQNDVYSLGVVLYEMLTRRMPKNFFSFEPIRKINPSISPKLANLIHKCLELDKSKRPVAKEILDEQLKLHRKES